MLMKAKWVTDGESLRNFDDKDTFLYRNGLVTQFLSVDDTNFIIASKGIGKTLLLNYKRHLLEEKYDGQGYCFLPKNQNFIDFVAEVKNPLPKGHIDKLRDVSFCKRLWQIAFEISVITNVYTFDEISKISEAYNFKTPKIKQQFMQLVKTERSASYVFGELLNFNTSSLSGFIAHAANDVREIFRNVGHPVYMFIDRLDNALTSSDSSIWSTLQVGLLEAAWVVMSNNSHVKIYLSIRQEAYASIKTDNANAISSRTVRIQYTSKELRGMVDKLTNYYEKNSSFENFIGIHSFPNSVTDIDEPTYDYIVRFSLGRPRDVVRLCGELSNLCEHHYETYEKRRENFKNGVIRAAQDIVEWAYEETHHLLSCLKDKRMFEDFIRLIPKNVLTYDDIQAICSKFVLDNKKNNCDIFHCDKICNTCGEENHPFCDLYNMGLIGLIEKDFANNQRVQRFKAPHDSWKKGLKNEFNIYLVHPALRSYIMDLKKAAGQDDTKYLLLRHTLVGNKGEWTQLNDDNLAAKNYMSSREINNMSIEEDESMKKNGANNPIEVFISYAWANKNKVESLCATISSLGFKPIIDSMLELDYTNLDDLMNYGLSKEKIIVVLSEEYKKKAEATNGSGGGVESEFRRIFNEWKTNNQKFVFVCFEPLTNELLAAITPSQIGNIFIIDLDSDRHNNFIELRKRLLNQSDFPDFEPKNPPDAIEKKEIKPL